MWFLFIIVPLALIGLVSVALALLPVSRIHVRLAYCIVHALLSVVLILGLDGAIELWAFVLGPGLLISVGRLLHTGNRTFLTVDESQDSSIGS